MGGEIRRGGGLTGDGKRIKRKGNRNSKEESKEIIGGDGKEDGVG